MADIFSQHSGLISQLSTATNEKATTSSPTYPPSPRLQFPPRLRIHLHNLVDSLILRQLQPILLADIRRHKPATHEMPSRKIPRQRLRRRQAHQRRRTEALSGALARRARLDIPRARRVHRRNGDTRLRERTDDGREGLAHLAREGEPEDGVDDVVRVLQRAVEVVGEGDAEGAQLRGEALVELVGRLFGVVDGGAVGVVVEVARGDEAVAAVVSAAGRQLREAVLPWRGAYGPQATRISRPLWGGWSLYTWWVGTMSARVYVSEASMHVCMHMRSLRSTDRLGKRRACGTR